MEPNQNMEQPSVLVVDDHAEVRGVIARQLRQAGFKVADSANGVEALGYLENEGPVCVIVLDLEMPTMTGWEFMTVCSKHPTWRQIPIVVLTAYGPADLVSEVINGIPVVTKPFKFEELLAEVRLAIVRPLSFLGMMEKG